MRAQRRIEAGHQILVDEILDDDAAIRLQSRHDRLERITLLEGLQTPFRHRHDLRSGGGMSRGS
jgi:hypothetical protein